MLVDKTVKVEKEADELMEGTAKFLGDIRKALADGWQPGQDLPVVLSAALADLVPAVQGVEKLGDELKESEEAFTRTFALGGHKILYVFKNPVKA